MSEELFPGMVFVTQPGFGNYRVFLTGGMRDANLWRTGKYNDRYSFESLKAIGAPVRKIDKGVYALAPENPDAS